VSNIASSTAPILLGTATVCHCCSVPLLQCATVAVCHSCSGLLWAYSTVQYLSCAPRVPAGTFTLSNLGMSGVDRFDAVVQKGQVPSLSIVLHCI